MKGEKFTVPPPPRQKSSGMTAGRIINLSQGSIRPLIGFSIQRGLLWNYIYTYIYKKQIWTQQVVFTYFAQTLLQITRKFTQSQGITADTLTEAGDLIIASLYCPETWASWVVSGLGPWMSINNQENPLQTYPQNIYWTYHSKVLGDISLSLTISRWVN